MDEIGNLLRTTRESSGITIDEAGKDLEIKDVILENIESGRIGAFKDIYELKKNLTNYAKYLGLDANYVLKEFNEYLFEYTSKIPVKEIEKAVKEKEKKAKDTVKVVSPYTQTTTTNSVYLFLIYFLVFILISLTIWWSIKQITVNRNEAAIIGYYHK